jgi:hypothetical protein
VSAFLVDQASKVAAPCWAAVNAHQIRCCLALGLGLSGKLGVEIAMMGCAGEAIVAAGKSPGSAAAWEIWRGEEKLSAGAVTLPASLAESAVVHLEQAPVAESSSAASWALAARVKLTIKTRTLNILVTPGHINSSTVAVWV